MRVSRFLTGVTFLTCFALLYVYQQTEIFRLGYVGQKKKAVFQELLDKNSLLRYNIERKSSLTDIGNIISDSSDFQMPDSYRLVRIAPLKQRPNLAKKAKNQETFLARIFGVKKTAEARTFGP